MQLAAVRIGRRPVGPGCPVYIIAELSANHDQRYAKAVDLIRAAKDAGADAVKLQTYTPDTLTIDERTEPFRIGGSSLWAGQTLYELYAKAYIPWEWHADLKRLAEELELDFFSTAFDPTAADFLERLDVPAYKVASFELIDLPLIEHIARKGRPVLMSSGMATLAEIGEALDAARRAGATQIVLLKCTSAYPASPEEMNLRTIPDLVDTFGVPVGLSDHTLGTTVPVAAVALGACVIEKHFTLSRAAPGPDAAFSLEPAEFKAMVDAVRVTEQALGVVRYGLEPREAQNRVFRRSLFVVSNMAAGDIFTPENVRSIRPAGGLPPKFLSRVLGRSAAVAIGRGTPLRWDLIA